MVDQIKALAELRDAGILTEAEFQEKKAEVLARIQAGRSMSSAEAPLSPVGKPSTGFWVSTLVAIVLVGIIGGIGSAIVAWRRGYRTAAKWLSIVSVVWTAIVVGLVVLFLSHVPGPSAGQIQSKLASQFSVSNVTCNMPGSWTPGTTFGCFANHESFTLTVEKSTGTEFRWYVQENG